jgi:hypothetical protein
MANRTPTFIDEFVRANQHRFDMPVQYLGDEPNSYRKDWDTSTVRALLAASWPYQAAAGNQSIPAVYKAINIGESVRGGRPFLCDRYYLPATPRDLKTFEREGVPVFGIESKHQMRDFDVVMTSISYPVLSLSFVKLLKMSDMPVRRRERVVREDYPMVMVGGQSYGAPEVLAPIIDCFWLGEVEEEPDNPGIGTVFARIEQFKMEGRWQTDRLGCYRDLAREFNFLYFPEFVDVQYEYEDRSAFGVGVEIDSRGQKGIGLNEDGSVRLSKQVYSFKSNLTGLRMPFLKRIVKDFNKVEPLTNPPLLYSDPGMGAGDLEVARGCPAWCTFCALTYRTKPYRERDVAFMAKYAQDFIKNMGSTHLTPFSPDLPMYPRRKELIKTLLEQASDEVDAGAMRVDDFIADSDFITLQVYGGMDGVTLGVEGNSQRMRDLVGKGTSDKDVEEAVARAIHAGVKKIKLFMISNLPGENEGDVMRVLQLARNLADIRDQSGQPNVRIQFSWTPLMIEANTPFQWFPAPSSTRALGDVWEEFRALKIAFKLGGKSEKNKSTFFQLCQRASREVGEALVDAMIELDTACWGGVPKTSENKLGMHDTILLKLAEHGFLNGLEDCFDERTKSDMFGWEFIDQGISPELLWVTYQQMLEFVENTDAHTYDENFDDSYHGSEWIARCDTQCMGKTCGVCDHKDLKLRREYIVASRNDYQVTPSDLRPIDQRSEVMRIRAKLVKSDRYRQIMNDHWRFNLRRAANQAFDALGFPGFLSKRSIRFVSDDIKYRDWTSGVDYVEFALTRKMSVPEVKALLDEMNARLLAVPGEEETRWFKITDWQRFSASAPNMRTDIDYSLWELELNDDPGKVLGKLAIWDEAEEVSMTLKQEGGYYSAGPEVVNAKEYVKDMWLVKDGHRLFLRMLLKGRPSPYNIYAALMQKASWLEAAAIPARRIDAFVEMDEDQYDFFRVACESCEKVIPVNVLDKPYDLNYCPVCKDRVEGKTLAPLEMASR